MSGTGQGNSPKNVFESGALSKFSTTEFNFIYENRTDARANSAPNGSNIGTSRPISSMILVEGLRDTRLIQPLPPHWV